ncbi:MAG: ATP-binding protein [Planctomycetota bacterium]
MERLGDRTPVTLRDLGFGKTAIVTATLSVGALPATLGLYFDVSPLSAIGIAGGGLAAASTAIYMAARRLRRSLLEPIDEIVRAMDQLRSSGQAPRISEAGAPLLQPMMRRFNMASLALEQRGRQSLANLMSVEAAFDRVHAVLQSLREGVVVVDPSGRIVMANRNARRMLAFADGHVEAEMLLDKVDGELRAALREGLERVDGGKVGERHIGDVRHRDSILDLSIVQVQSNRPDQDFGKVVVLADVTRNHELNRLKDELLSSISHELRTPLTNMCSSSEILTTLTPEDEAEWREFAGMLNSESRRLKTLVDDVMEYSMLETRRTSWNIERVDLCQIVRTAVKLIEPAAADKSVAIEVTGVDRAMALLDSQRIHEVLCRILDNAVKFTPNDGRVRVEVLEHDGLVDLTVSDSGPGVAPEDRQRVFERFSQIGDVMTEKPQGTGLGLSIVQRIVDAMGGTIWCDDSPLGGASFRFVVPQATIAES